MNYKRHKPTSRHEGKRLEQKSFRARERQAIINGVINTTAAWEHRALALPLGDVPSNGKIKKRKLTPKKKTMKCLPGHSHEWVHDRWVSEDPYILWTGRTIVYRYQHHNSLCVNCERLIERRVRMLNHFWRESRKLALKKRPIDLVRGW